MSLPVSKDDPSDAVMHDEQGDDLHLDLGEVGHQDDGVGHEERGLLDRVLQDLLSLDDQGLGGGVHRVPRLLLADREHQLKVKA